MSRNVCFQAYVYWVYPCLGLRLGRFLSVAVLGVCIWDFSMSRCMGCSHVWGCVSFPL